MPTTETHSPTDADLIAGIRRGIATGDFIVVDDAYLAAMAADIAAMAAEIDAPPARCAGTGTDLHSLRNLSSLGSRFFGVRTGTCATCGSTTVRARKGSRKANAHTVA